MFIDPIALLPWEDFTPFARFFSTKELELAARILIRWVGLHAVETYELTELRQLLVAELHLEEVGQLPHAPAQVCLHVFVHDDVEVRLADERPVTYVKVQPVTVAQLLFYNKN